MVNRYPLGGSLRATAFDLAWITLHFLRLAAGQLVLAAATGAILIWATEFDLARGALERAGTLRATSIDLA